MVVELRRDRNHGERECMMYQSRDQCIKDSSLWTWVLAPPAWLNKQNQNFEEKFVSSEKCVGLKYIH